MISNFDYHRRRAQRVLHLLRELWGDELPDGPEPELTVLIDAVAGDDHLGAQDGYVVQSDRLTYDALALLLRRCSTPDVAAGALPRELLSRVFSAAHPHHDALNVWRLAPREETTPDRQELAATGRAATAPFGVALACGAEHSPVGLPTTVGTWHLDAYQQLSWDDAAAAVLARLDAPRCASVVEEVEVWVHPEDRVAVEVGFERCLEHDEPHQVRFRALNPRGGYVPCVASGRRLVDAGGELHVVGVIYPDPAAP